MNTARANQLVEEALRAEHPQRIAASCLDQQWTYDELRLVSSFRRMWDFAYYTVRSGKSYCT